METPAASAIWRMEISSNAYSANSALPASISYLETRAVGPSLGATSVHQGVVAAIAGMLAVMVFMLIYYRGAGFNADLALMLTAIAGPDPRCPLSHGDPSGFADEPRGDLVGLRVAWCPDLGGLPIAPQVMAVLDGARHRLEAAGCQVGEVPLDLSAADEAFETLRGLGFVRAFGAAPPALRASLKETIAWNLEQGLALDGPAVARAIAARSTVFATVAALLERVDVLAAPAAQVAPFPVEEEYPLEVAGVVTSPRPSPRSQMW